MMTCNFRGFVPPSTLYVIARLLARRIGIAAPDFVRMSKVYEEGVYPSQPLVMCGEGGTLWLDKYYAAFANEQGQLSYAYVSGRYLREEMSSWRRASKPLPEEIARALTPALKHMSLSGRDVWLSGEILSASSLKSSVGLGVRSR